MRLTTVIQILAASLLAAESQGATRADLLSKHVIDLTESKFEGIDWHRKLQAEDPEEIPEEPTPTVGTTDSTPPGTGTGTDPEEVPEEETPTVGEGEKETKTSRGKDVRRNMDDAERKMMRRRVMFVAVITGIITAVVVSIFWIVVMLILKKRQNNNGLVTVKDSSQPQQVELKNEQGDVTVNPINTSVTPDIANSSLKLDGGDQKPTNELV